MSTQSALDHTMLRRHSGWPSDMTCWVDLEQPDPAAAVAFYGELLGWELTDVMPAGSPWPYYVARRYGGDVAAISAERTDVVSRAWNTYISVADIGATAAAVRAAGGDVRSAPEQIGDAGVMAICADPAGAEFRLWQPAGFAGADFANAPGTWQWSNPRVPADRVEDALAFYRSVFGWEGARRDFGEYASIMLTLPGYGEWIDTHHEPGFSDRHRNGPSPDGYEDVFAFMLEADGEPAWGVEFGVEDCDAAAAAAVRLGGEVVVAPFDAPWVRSAVVRDPQGAVFTINEFRPPAGA